MTTTSTKNYGKVWHRASWLGILGVHGDALIGVFDSRQINLQLLLRKIDFVDSTSEIQMKKLDEMHLTSSKQYSNSVSVSTVMSSFLSLVDLVFVPSRVSTIKPPVLVPNLTNVTTLFSEQQP